MVHNYYIDFLKSFKKFMSMTFPAINQFQFNYSDKTFLSWKLYQETVKEYPMCIIGLTDIRVDDNAAYFRHVGDAYSQTTIQPLCTNHDTKQTVIMDFKWVVLQMQVKLNVNSPTDLFNYHNLLISAFPKNMMFYSYDYGSYIDVDTQTNTWAVSDNTEGLVYRVTAQEGTKGFALYMNSPLFKINEVTKNKGIEGESSILMDLEVQLKVPNVIGTSSRNNVILEGIQIVINQMGNDSGTPILIDMNNDIYSDRRQKMKGMYLLNKNDFNITDNTLELPIEMLDNIKDRKLAIYQVSDCTSIDPIIYFYEYGTLDLTKDVTSNSIVIPLIDNQANFYFNEFSVLELLIFD